jgi:hypothetical protein
MRDFFSMAMDDTIDWFVCAKDVIVEFAEDCVDLIVIPGICLLGYVLVVVTTPLWIIPYLIFKRRR